MAKLLKLRRGSTSQHSSFTGAEGEVTVDTTKDTLVVHDGSTAGGIPLAKESGNIATATTASVGTNVTVTANNSTDETVYPVFVDGATGTQGIESDTGLTYNPSSGKLTATEFVGNIDAVDGDFDGTLEADAITVGGTALNTVIAGVTVSNATNAATFTTTANNSTNETVYPVFVDGATGAQGAETDTGLTYNPSTGLLTTGAVTTTGNVIVGGDLWVSGATTTVNSTTLTVDDKNIELGSVSSPSDTTADGGGITLKGATDKTFNWVDATDAWTSSEHIHLGDNKKLFLGTGQDFFAVHDGTDTYLRNTAGNLYIQPKTSETAIKAVPDGQVELYNDNVKVLETVNNGIKVLGSDGNNAFVYISADEGADNADQRRLLVDTNGDFYVQNYADGAWETDIMAYQSEVRLYYDNALKLQTSSTGITVTGAVSDSKGDVRKIPSQPESSAHTPSTAHVGYVIYISSGGVTFNNNTFSAGDVITVVNNSGSNQTITQGSGLTIYNSADAATGNRTLAGRGMATIWFAGASTAYISGAGLS